MEMKEFSRIESETKIIQARNKKKQNWKKLDSEISKLLTTSFEMVQGGKKEFRGKLGRKMPSADDVYVRILEIQYILSFLVDVTIFGAVFSATTESDGGDDLGIVEAALQMFLVS